MNSDRRSAPNLCLRRTPIPRGRRRRRRARWPRREIGARRGGFGRHDATSETPESRGVATGVEIDALDHTGVNDRRAEPYVIKVRDLDTVEEIADVAGWSPTHVKERDPRNDRGHAREHFDGAERVTESPWELTHFGAVERDHPRWLALPGHGDFDRTNRLGTLRSVGWAWRASAARDVVGGNRERAPENALRTGYERTPVVRRAAPVRRSTSWQRFRRPWRRADCRRSLLRWRRSHLWRWSTSERPRLRHGPPRDKQPSRSSGGRAAPIRAALCRAGRLLRVGTLCPAQTLARAALSIPHGRERPR